MGSLTSSPKIKPAKTQVIYMPSPAPVYVPPPATSSGSANTGSNTGPTGSGSANENTRAESLLLRDRGRFGTVLTGFRGLLAPMADGIRKTLLGE